MYNAKRNAWISHGRLSFFRMHWISSFFFSSTGLAMLPRNDPFHRKPLSLAGPRMRIATLIATPRQAGATECREIECNRTTGVFRSHSTSCSTHIVTQRGVAGRRRNQLPSLRIWKESSNARDRPQTQVPLFPVQYLIHLHCQKAAPPPKRRICADPNLLERCEGFTLFQCPATRS